MALQIFCQLVTTVGNRRFHSKCRGAITTVEKPSPMSGASSTVKAPSQQPDERRDAIEQYKTDQNG